jgi:hypothetical protein
VLCPRLIIVSATNFEKSELDVKLSEGLGSSLRRSNMADGEGRTAKQIIDQAIRENRFGAHLLYGFATIFVLAGIFALVAGVLQKQGGVAIAGSIGSALFFPAMWQARGIRKENISIRLMELPLSKAETAEEAAKALNDFFVSTLINANNG